MITASNCATALGENKKSTLLDFLIDKTSTEKKQHSENIFVYHGKKYEYIAILIYECIYNIKIGEFGLL